MDCISDTLYSAGNMKHPAGSRYVTSNQAYPTVGATSRSKPHSHDLVV